MKGRRTSVCSPQVKIPKLLTSALVCAALSSALSAEEGFTSIFNGKNLDGWKSGHSKEAGDYGPFKVDEKEQVIHVYQGAKAGSKQDSDSLYTEKDYSRYVLRLEYKWLEERFAPRNDQERDAGLLFHAHGDLSKVWPLSMEMQIGETPAKRMGRNRYHVGDLFVLGNKLRCKTTKTDGNYDPDAPLVQSSHCPTQLGVEKPKGEWNQVEIVVDGAKKVTFKLNGEVVHEIQDLEMQVDGKWVPMDHGRVALQAEWAELLYRNVRIKEL